MFLPKAACFSYDSPPFSAVSLINVIRSASLIFVWALQQLSFPLIISSLLFSSSQRVGVLATFLPQSLFTISPAPSTFPLLLSATEFLSFYICAHAFLHLGAGYGAHQNHLHDLFFPLHTLAKWELCSWFFSESRKLCLFWWHCSWVRDAKAPVSKWQSGQMHPVPVRGQRKQLLVLLRQFFSATGWTIVTISTIQLLCIYVLCCLTAIFVENSRNLDVSKQVNIPCTSSSHC